MNWVLLALFTGVIYGLVELLDKFVLDNEVKDPFLSALFNKLPNFVVFGVSGIIFGEVIWSLEIIAVSALLVFLYILASFNYYSGIQKEEVSRFIPTLSMNTVFIVLISFIFLGEQFDLVTYSGIFLTIAGAFLISMEKPSRRVIHSFQSSTAVMFALGASFLWAARDVVLKFMTSQVEIFSLLFWIGIIGTPTVLFLIELKSSKVSNGDFKGFEHLLMIGFLVSIGYLVFLEAISSGPVSLASVLVKVDAAVVFIGSVLATYLDPEDFHEKISKKILLQKVIALMLIAGGILLIQVF